MQDANEDKQGDVAEVEAVPTDIIGDEGVRKNGDGGKRKLHNRGVEGRDVTDKFLIDDNNEGVEHRRTKGKQASLQRSADKHHAADRGKRADCTDECNTLAKEDCGEDKHKNGGEVINEGGCGDGCVVIGFKEQNPVRTDECTRDKEGENIFLYCGK